jgi:hypothetical protein
MLRSRRAEDQGSLRVSLRASRLLGLDRCEAGLDLQAATASRKLSYVCACCGPPLSSNGFRWRASGVHLFRCPAAGSIRHHVTQSQGWRAGRRHAFAKSLIASVLSCIGWAVTLALHPKRLVVGKPPTYCTVAGVGGVRRAEAERAYCHEGNGNRLEEGRKRLVNLLTAVLCHYCAQLHNVNVRMQRQGISVHSLPRC